MLIFIQVWRYENPYQVNLPPEASFCCGGFLADTGDLRKPTEFESQVIETLSMCTL